MVRKGVKILILIVGVDLSYVFLVNGKKGEEIWVLGGIIRRVVIVLVLWVKCEE